MAYKHVIRAKTKNLFKFSNEIGTLTGGFGPNVARNFEEGKWYIGLTSNNYYAPNNITSYSIKDNLITVNTKALGYGLGRAFKTTAQVSYYFTTTGFFAVGFYNSSGEKISHTAAIRNKGAFTTPDTCAWFTIVLRPDPVDADCIYQNMQLELGSTPTPYTPYNYLQSNKRMIKVNSVCQLFDKSKFPATLTEGGVTFTNNGDGTITANGTSTKNYAHYPIIVPRPAIGHKILVLPKSNDNTQDHIYVYGCNDKGVWQDDIGYGGNIITITGIGNSLKNPYTRICINLNVNKDWVMNNHIYKPQLFDLTEMYGAGHEPATVAEFRQRFPNELYPYSPQCWLTSYKSAVVCKTKNLFDVNNAVPYTFTNDNPPSSRISLKDGIYTTTYNNYNVGSGLRIKDGLVLSPGTYTLSLSVITVGETTPITGLTYGFRLYKSDGTKPVITTYTEKFNSRCSHTFTIPGDCTDIRLYLAPHCNSGQEYVYISLKDIQVEQGSTATSYVPYQHL